jgi:hypothetical protein
MISLGDSAEAPVISGDTIRVYWNAAIRGGTG